MHKSWKYISIQSNAPIYNQIHPLALKTHFHAMKYIHIQPNTHRAPPPPQSLFSSRLVSSCWGREWPVHQIGAKRSRIVVKISPASNVFKPVFGPDLRWPDFQNHKSGQNTPNGRNISKKGPFPGVFTFFLAFFCVSVIYRQVANSKKIGPSLLLADARATERRFRTPTGVPTTN